MKNFIYYNPTKVIFGKETYQSLKDEVLKYGNKVLLVYGGDSIVKNGIYKKITKNLEDAKITYYNLNNVTADLKDVYRGIEEVKNKGVQIVIALGGGSCIDTAKAIALGARSDTDIWNYLNNGADYCDIEVLPMGAIVTVAASGSEVDGNAEIYDRKSNLHGSLANIFPKFTILDPELTYGVPEKLTAYNGACTIIQGMEQYINNEKSTSIQDGFLETIFSTSIDSLKILKCHLDNYDARANMMWASALVCNRILGRGKNCTWQIGKLAHVIMEQYDVSYVVSLAIVFPKYLRIIAKEQSNILSQFAINVLGFDKAEDKQVLAIKTADWLQNFFIEQGIVATYAEVGINANIENLSQIVKKTAEESGLKQKQVEDIIKMCL